MQALLTLVALISPGQTDVMLEALPLAAERHEHRLVITAGGEPFTELRFEPEAQKPYLYPLLGPDGVALTRSWPLEEAPNEAHDHPHHTSLWLAHGDVNGHDFWHKGSKPEGYARIALRELSHEVIEGKRLRATAKLEWLDPAGELVCRETRTLTFHALTNRRTIDVTAEFSVPAGEAVFGDTKEGTFAIRMRPEMRLKGSVAAGHALNSTGIQNGKVWGKRAKWIVYWGPLDGRTYSVALLDHPANPRHPTWWHARDYGLCGANPFGIHDFEKRPEGTGDLTVRPDEPLRLAWQVVLSRGQLGSADMDRVWTRFAKTVGGSPAAKRE